MIPPSTALVGFSVALVLAGCGAGQKASETLQPPTAASGQVTTTATTGATTTSGTKVISPATLTNDARAKITSSDGYSATIELLRGPLMHAAPMTIGGYELGSSCQVDDQTDAVEPFELVLRNTTPNFQDTPTAEIGADSGTQDTLPLESDVGFGGSNNECVNFVSGGYDGDGNGTDVLDVEPNNSLADGQSTVTWGFFVAQNYYSPAHPAGDPGAFDQIVLTINPEGGGDQWSDAGGTGLLSSQAISNAVAFLPGGNGGCIIQQPCGSGFSTGN